MFHSQHKLRQAQPLHRWAQNVSAVLIFPMDLEDKSPLVSKTWKGPHIFLTYGLQ